MQFKDIGESKTANSKTCESEIKIKVSDEICKSLQIEGADCKYGYLIVKLEEQSISKLRAKMNAWLRIISMLQKVEEVIKWS